MRLVQKIRAYWERQGAANLAVTVICLAFISQIFLSWPLWSLVGRTFPTVPLWSVGLSQYGHFQAWGLVVLLAACAVFSQKKWLVGLLMVWLLLLIALDVNRLQVWVWFYGLLLLALNLPNVDATFTYRTARGIIAAVYCWGGINKISPYFAEDQFPWFCRAFSWLNTYGDMPWLGYMVALGEMSLGVGLLWPKSRILFVWLAVVFHLFICLALSPWGLGWNYVVIPWNLAMIALLFILFYQPVFLYSAKISLTNLRSQKIGLLLLTLVWLCPLGGFWGFWPEPLSWKMYSGTNSEATIFYPSGSAVHFSAQVQAQVYGEKEQKLSMDDWAYVEMQVPPFAAEFIYRKVGKIVCETAGLSDGSGMYILTVNPWDKSKEVLLEISCGELH